MAFENSSYYIFPIIVDSQEKLHNYLIKSYEWQFDEQTEKNYGHLFSHVSRIVESSEMCRIYRYRDPYMLPIYLFSAEVDAEEIPLITEVSLYAFETGVGFFEVKVDYGSMKVNEIVRFAYFFKIANRAEKAKYVKGNRKSLYRVMTELLPEELSGARCFFTGRSADKYQGLSFHMIKTDWREQLERDTLLFRLKRSYNEAFLYSDRENFGRYDMAYCPYEYMAFGGCQEGFVALCRETGVSATDFFINEYFYPQLTHDYHLMYLILLNQRFSELRYVEEIATAAETKSLAEEINEKTVRLRTRYSFRVVSDDYICQDVYARMYDVLDIETLFFDVEGNGIRLSMMENNERSETEKDNNVFLMCLSFLAVFSALVDLAAYLDRMSVANLVSTILSAAGVIGIFACAAVRFFRQRKKRNKKK